MNIIPNYQFKINSEITNNQTNPNFLGKQQFLAKGNKVISKNNEYILDKIKHTKISSAAKQSAPRAIPAGTVLAVQNGKNTDTIIERIAQKVPILDKKIIAKFIQDYPDFLTTSRSRESLNVLPNYYADMTYNNFGNCFDLSMRKLMRDRRIIPHEYIYKSTPDKFLVHTSDLLNPDELKNLEFGKDYILLAHNTNNNETTAFVKEEGLKCFFDIDPQKAVSKMQDGFYNDPFLIYFRPITGEYKYNINENTIVVAIPKGAGYVCNQDMRADGLYHQYVHSAMNLWEFDYRISTLKPGEYLSHLKDIVPYNSTKDVYLPEVCFGDSYIPPKYFVDTSKIQDLLNSKGLN